MHLTELAGFHEATPLATGLHYLRGQKMQDESVERIRVAMKHAHDAVERADVAGCDISDIDELVETVDREFEQAKPNIGIVALSLNSLARSLLSTDSGMRAAADELDAAMRAARIPTTWEN
jgi:hypothetical protein